MRAPWSWLDRRGLWVRAMVASATAPEGLTLQKASAASDAWSFGVVCVDIFQDGAGTYSAIRSNSEVMTFINNGEVHPQPVGCTDEDEDECTAAILYTLEGRVNAAERALVDLRMRQRNNVDHNPGPRAKTGNGRPRGRRWPHERRCLDVTTTQAL